MSERSRIRVLTAVLAGAMLVAGGRHDTEAAEATPDRPLSAGIIGEWTSDPFQTHVGTATQTFCFRADGTAAVHTDTKTGARDDRGTYMLDANRLTVRLSKTGSSVVLQVSWSDERLVLTDESSEARSYRRTSVGC